MSHKAISLSPEETAELLRQNAEMRRLLSQHQWSGVTPARSRGVCPECCGQVAAGTATVARLKPR